MANSSRLIEILLQLNVEGTGDAERVLKLVGQLRTELTKLDGSKELDEVLGLKEANAEFNQAYETAKAFAGYWGKASRLRLDLDVTKVNKDLDLVLNTAKKVANQFDILTKGGETKVLFDVGKANKDLDLVVDKVRKVIDLTVRAGKAPSIIDVSKLKGEMDILVGSIKNTMDMYTQLGKQKVTIDLSKLKSVTEEAARGAKNLNQTLKQTAVETTKVQEAHYKHRNALVELTREFLFLRRAAVGLGFVALSREILEVATSFDRAKQAITSVFGEIRSAEEFQFVQEQAERLGISIADLAAQYAKFSASAKALGLSQQVVRDNFLAVAEAGAKLALSSEEITGALTAIQQIASKGRLSMEELRQQLGDRIPGAISIAAKALGVTEERLFALVEAGNVTSDLFLSKFPAALRASFGTDSATRIETTTATLQRFKNALAEVTDQALRAGLLDAFTDTVKALTAALKDPAVIANIKGIARGLGELITFARENIDLILKLIGAYAGFKGLQFVTDIMGKFGVALTLALEPMKAFAPVLVKGADGMMVMQKASLLAIPAVEGLVIALKALAAVAIQPITIALVGVVAAGLALNEYGKKLIAAKDAANEFQDAERSFYSNNRIIESLMGHIEALEFYRDTVKLTVKDIDKLTYENIKSYEVSVKGAKELADLEAREYQARIDRSKAIITAVGLQTQATEEQLQAAADATQELTAYTAQQQTAIATGKQWAKVLADINTVLGTTEGTLQKVQIGDLTKDVKKIVETFDDLVKKSKDVEEAIKKAIPDNFADGGLKQLQDVGEAMKFLENTGRATGQTINNVLSKALDKLNGDQLARFQVQAERAFGTSAKNAQQLGIILDSSLSAALKNIGLDAETAGTHVSKAFNQMLDNVVAVGKNARATGAQLRASLDIAIDAAKTREELLLIQAAFKNTDKEGNIAGKNITDSLTRLQDKLRLTAGVITGPLGDSMKRLGIESKATLNGIAQQAEIDFNRVKYSGVASALDIEAAFKVMAENLAKANGGIPPIKLYFDAVATNSFDVIVKMAEVASERVKKAVEGAIPLADTKAKLQLLAEAMEDSFARGALAAEDFGKLVTEVGYKIREVAAKPVGELAAAADLLGLKTKDQMKAVADNTREAFQEIVGSGQFTNAELVKGAQTFMDAYIAANNGVIDSFDPVVMKAQELLSKVDETTKSLEEMAAASKMSDPIARDNLGTMGPQELQQFLADTMKAYRDIGVKNVEDLNIVQEIQREMNRQGAVNAANMLAADAKLNESLEKQRNNTVAAVDAGTTAKPSGGVLPGGGGGAGSIYNFNFNGTALTPDAVKREVMPVLNNSDMRRR